ncbi:MAG: hypothetical protein JSV19_01690 [Phycisphaerales bacterium]|nr:MAG: hypothetical protein JSV19_01690 [Phycisphaerales bacterium]
MDAIAQPADLFTMPGPVLVAATLSAQQIATIVVIVGIGAVLLIATRRRVARNQNSPRAYVREQIRQIREEQRVSREVRHVMLELEQLSRQIHAEIDTKSAKLASMLRTADRRIEALGRLARDADGSPVVDASVSGDARADLAGAGRHDDGRVVYELADTGCSTAEIGQQTGMDPAEVELLLALRAQAEATR